MSRELLSIDNARIIFRNFSGEASKFNREGDRNFCVVLDNADAAIKLADEGWNVKIRPPREDGDEPFYYLPVKVKFSQGSSGPNVYLASGRNRVKLDEESISCLDDVDIVGCDMDIRPYDWEVSGKTGRTAYLQAMLVTQSVDRFAASFQDESDNDDLPFDM